jgi:hypothetical protein
MKSRAQNYHKKQGHREIESWSWNDLRLWSKIDTTEDEHGCHNWLASISPSGALMGAYKNGHQQMTQVRRLVWMSLNNKDVTPYQVTLTCHNQRCCNPRHFELKENNRKNLYDR